MLSTGSSGAMSEDIPSIPEFYRDKKVFITGGSGFMGKVLVEKLLRSCPDVGTVYLLLRAKRNTPPSLRIAQITQSPLFDRIRRECPDVLDKLVAVSGDVMELGLGLSDEDRRMLHEEVSIIFHSAASVRFDDPIKDSILMNVRGTREVVNLALGMKNLKVMLHLSTAYCNFDKPEVLEQLYPAPGDWRKMIEMAEKYEDPLLRMLTPKIIGRLPNTYTYAKALGEHVINDHRHLLPLVIVRPSIVTCSNDEPMPGWNDNFNGPFSLSVAIGKSIITSIHGDPELLVDYVPVDIAIKAMLFIALQRAYKRDGSTLDIYNACKMTRRFTYGDQAKMGHDFLFEEYPYEGMLWFPTGTFTTCFPKHFLKTIFFQLLPAMILDGILTLRGGKPMLVKLTRSVYVGSNSLYPFLVTQVDFKNDKFLGISSQMLDSDIKDFAYHLEMPSVKEYLTAGYIGTRLFLLREPNSSIPRSIVRYRRMYWLHQITKSLFFALLVWLLASCSPIRETLLSVRILQ